MSQRIVPIEIEPVILKTSDGKERKFLLSAGGINRLKNRFSVKTVLELLTKDESASQAVLWESLLDKGDMTEEQFNDILVYNPALIAKAVGLLLGASFPDPPLAASNGNSTTTTATGPVN